MVDDTGRELIDLNSNFTSLVHGNAHPAISAAAEIALYNGASFGLPTTSELAHGERLLQRFPELNRVRYTNSGTEAVMTALRIARAHTGRANTVFVHSCYHGTSDTVLAAGGTTSTRGIPPSLVESTTTIPINDIDALVTAVDAQPERFAAIVLDLLPNRAGLIPLTQDFADAAARLCDTHGIMLIVDEVISFRLRTGGLASEYRLLPHLVTLGKIIGGGFPVGAVVGRADVMEELNPLLADAIEHGGTFSANPVTMEAGCVALDLLDHAAIDRVNALGDAARLELEKYIVPLGWEVRGTGSLFRPFPPADTDSGPLRRALWWAAYERGILLTQNGLAAVSTVMDRTIVLDAAQRIADAVDAVCAASVEAG